MVKSRLLGVVGIVAVVGGGIAGMRASQAPVTQAFEVTSIKHHAENPSVRISKLPPGPPARTARFQSSGRFTADNASLSTLLVAAYRGAWPQPLGPALQVSGGPDWTRTDGFDIHATAQGDPSVDQMERMLRTLLRDRFALSAHVETRRLPAYNLVLARKDGKLGPRIHPSACVNTPPSAPPDPRGRPRCADRFGSHPQDDVRGLNRLVVTSATMDQLARVFEPLLRTAVYNQTGLAGTFDADMASTASRAPVLDGADNPGFWTGRRTDMELTPVPLSVGWSKSMFDVMPDQLGLKLESTTGPVDVLVIDHVEHPTPD